jgi:hypothetical protein
MKHLSLLVCLACALGTLAQAQPQGQAGASGKSQGSVSAGRSGATAQGSTAAAADAGGHGMQAAAGGGTEMNATLSKPVDAGSAKPGDEVTAVAAEDMKSNGQVVIPKGSKLIGHVTSVRPADRDRARPAESGPSAAGSASSTAGSELGVVFDRAIVKGGREVPLHAALQAIAAAETASSFGMSEGDFAMSGAGGGMAGGRAGGGGLLGGVGGTVRGAAGATPGIGAAAGSTIAGAASDLGHSVGAVGGLNAAGRFTSGSRGAFGMRDLDVTPAVAAGGEGSLVTSSTHTVRLDRGTRMLLVTGSASGAMGSAANVNRGAVAAGATGSASESVSATSGRGSTAPKADTDRAAPKPTRDDPDRR